MFFQLRLVFLLHTTALEQHITAGGAYVDKSLYCSQISDLISALIIYLCSFVLFFKTALNGWIARHEEKKAHKAAQTAGKGGEQA